MQLFCDRCISDIVLYNILKMNVCFGRAPFWQQKTIYYLSRICSSAQILVRVWWFSYFWCTSKWCVVVGVGGGGWGGESRNFLENAWQSWPKKGEQRHIFNSLQWGLSSLSLETPLYWDRVCQTMCKTQTPLELWLAFWVSFSRWLFSYYCPYLFWIPWDSTSHNSTRYIPVE